MSDITALRALADRQAITDLIHRYCRAVDRIDAELGYTIWHEDAVADYGEDIYQGTGRGFIDFVCEQHRKGLAHSHRITNVTIELDGDSAASEAYVTSDMRFMTGGKLMQASFWGRYVDQWSRRNGRWGIDKRITLRDFEEIHEPKTMGALIRGHCDRTDLSYTVLRGPQ